MTNRLFNCISIILHPIFTLTLGMVIIISVLLPGSLASQWMILAFCALYSVVMPMAFIGFARILGYVDDLRMRNKRSRIFALVVCAISILAFGHLLKNWHAPSVMQMFVTGVVVTLLIAALLAFFTRISLHTIGWGGLTAVVSFLSFSHPWISTLLAVVVLLAGLVGTARVYLNEHKPWQVYAGFAIGFVTIWMTFIICPVFGLQL